MGERIEIEPLGGPALDRLITALLNASGVMNRIVAAEPKPPRLTGEAVIGRIATRIRPHLCGVAEQYGDAEIEQVAQVLARATFALAAEAGLPASVWDVKT